MDRSSSTSSSEHDYLPDGLPVGLIMAVVMILVVEVCIRQLGHERMQPYGPGVGDFEAAVLHIRNATHLGDVCFIGSSRAREGISLPAVSATSSEELGRQVAASNLACGAARASENLTLVQALLRRHRPQLIVYVLSPRSLHGTIGPSAKRALFLDGTDLRATSEWHELAWTEWPTIARTEIGRFYRTLAYRSRAAVACRRLAATIRGDDVGQRWPEILLLATIPSPLLGSPTLSHFRDAGVSLLTRPISDERVSWYVDRLLVDGEYPLDKVQVEALHEIIKSCQQHGVSVVLAEAPVSNLLQRHWPPSTQATFQRMVGELARQNDVPFVTVDELHLSLDPVDFLEQSHLNAQGAEKYSAALTRAAIIPILRLADRNGTGTAKAPAK